MDGKSPDIGQPSPQELGTSVEVSSSSNAASSSPEAAPAISNVRPSTITRRGFLAGAAAFAATLFGKPNEAQAGPIPTQAASQVEIQNNAGQNMAADNERVYDRGSEMANSTAANTLKSGEALANDTSANTLHSGEEMANSIATHNLDRGSEMAASQTDILASDPNRTQKLVDAGAQTNIRDSESNSTDGNTQDESSIVDVSTVVDPADIR